MISAMILIPSGAWRLVGAARSCLRVLLAIVGINVAVVFLIPVKVQILPPIMAYDGVWMCVYTPPRLCPGSNAKPASCVELRPPPIKPEGPFELSIGAL